MQAVDHGLLEDLRARGLIAQMTSPEILEARLKEKPLTLYSGFDPTADSLHIGHLVPLLTLRRFQQAGHKPIALVGGATGLIGDPSFKATERQLNSANTVKQWVERLLEQLSCFIDFNDTEASAELVNNLDWVQGVDVLDFLRDVGKHFSVNNMINKESVKQRLERDGAGISFTEFTYMLLQSYDFAELYKRNGCILQIGGSDQWGNITGGIDLARRMHGAQTFGLTLPLVTKSDGTKFGKTESGAIWLSPQKTSPYAFYQFWLSTADADVYKFLKYFTFKSVDDLNVIEQEDRTSEGKPQAQLVLAEEMTHLVHGEAGLGAARRITEAMFSGRHSDLTESDLEQLKLDGLPSSSFSRAELSEVALTSLLSQCGMVKAGREVKDALGRGAVFINGEAKKSEDNVNHQNFLQASALYGRFYLIKLGKKKNHLIEVV